MTDIGVYILGAAILTPIIGTILLYTGILICAPFYCAWCVVRRLLDR